MRAIILILRIYQIMAQFYGAKTDERASVDCVACFDVLEHIYVLEVGTVLRNIFSHAKKLVILNVVCYEASALLPNGENAHITVRNLTQRLSNIFQIQIQIVGPIQLLVTSKDILCHRAIV